MNILVTNDDGIRAEGIATLARAAQRLGRVVAVAPDRERSACSHAMTMRDPLRIREVSGYDFEAFEVNGVPVDCVNVAREAIFHGSVDLVLSGINHGPNLGFDITYSGTAAGAMEGVINGIRSFAFSMATFVDGAPLHFDTAAIWIEENLERLLELPYDDLTFWNINIPAIAFEELAGERVTTMGRRVYEDRVEPRQDPWGRTYYWQGGVTVRRSDDPDVDVGAISAGFVSLTPVRMDWTAHDLVAEAGRSLTSSRAQL